MKAVRQPEVTIVYKHLPHYRVDFYNGLRVWLQERGVDLRLVVGQPIGQDVKKDDEGRVEWAERVRNVHVEIANRSIVWQPVLRRVRKSDLVVVEQANKLLVNNFLLAWRWFGGPRVAYWGHGFNRNRDTAGRISEAIKRRMVRRADWWFAYTESTTRYLVGLGVRAERATTVNNAIDVRQLREAVERMQANSPERQEVSLRCVYLGSLYASKRLDFLIAAGDEIARVLPGFALEVIGDGPQRESLEADAESRPWLRLHRALYGDDLVAVVLDGALLLVPGGVGLVILDSFAFGLPMVTVDVPTHGPEIDYLEPGTNGVMLPSGTTPGEYAAAVTELLNDDSRMSLLRRGCAASADLYTLEAMIERFGNGVIRALDRG